MRSSGPKVSPKTPHRNTARGSAGATFFTEGRGDVFFAKLCVHWEFLLALLRELMACTMHYLVTRTHLQKKGGSAMPRE